MPAAAKPVAKVQPPARVNIPARLPATVNKSITSKPTSAKPPVRPVASLPAKVGGRVGTVGTVRSTTKVPTATITPMAKKGVITPASRISGALSGAVQGAISSIPGIGGAIAGAIQGGNMVPGVGFIPHKKRHKGLTYNEIKGAMKLLRLVKRFAPPGHRAALRAKPRRSRIY